LAQALIAAVVAATRVFPPVILRVGVLTDELAIKLPVVTADPVIVEGIDHSGLKLIYLHHVMIDLVKIGHVILRLFDVIKLDGLSLKIDLLVLNYHTTPIVNDPSV
jgi:hypothetical protein